MPGSNDTKSTKWDAIVVGAGLGGLSAAAYLTAAGRRTLLLERYKVLGGSSHVFRRQGKWEFDIGLHYLGGCGPDGQAARVLRGLALEDRVNFRQLDRDGFDIVIGPDFELKIPASWDGYLDNLIGAFPTEERAIRRYLRVVRAIAEGIDHSRSAASVSGQVRALRSAGTAAPWSYMPHATLLAACGLSARAMLVLSQYSGGYASTPNATPVGMQAAYMDDYIGGGAWFPEGGGQTLAANFADVIVAHGGEIRTDADVERIIVEGGSVCGVRLADGEVFSAPVVVSDIDIKKTYMDLVGPENLSRRMVRRVERWKMAPPFFSAYFGLEHDMRQEPNANYFVIPSWADAKNVRSLMRTMPDLVTKAARRDPIEWANDYAARMTGFVFSGTTRDPGNDRSAPPGCGSVEVLSILPTQSSVWGVGPDEIADGSYRRSATYRKIKDIVTDGMFDRVEQVYPGAGAKVQWREASTPLTQSRFTGTQFGSGLEPRVGQFGFFRPRSTTEVRGLFMAGASTAWGPGTLGAMISGMHAAGAILGRDLDAEVQEGSVLADRDSLGTFGADYDPLAVCRGFGRSSGAGAVGHMNVETS